MKITNALKRLSQFSACVFAAFALASCGDDDLEDAVDETGDAIEEAGDEAEEAVD